MKNIKVYLLSIILVVNFRSGLQISTEDHKELADAEAFDFIVVGGGTGGCVVASRLAESGKHRVLLIEEGGIPNPNLEIPVFSTFSTFSSFPNEFKFYNSVPQRNAALNSNGVVQHAIGKVIGGGSSVNGMLWNRGSPHDYDNWANLTKDNSWSYQDMLKYLKRSENYTGSNPTDQRGYKGPISVSNPSYRLVTEELRQAGQEIGYPLGDPNGPQMPSLSRTDFSQKRGRRVGAFKGYIVPLLNTRKNYKNDGRKSNLQILLNTETKRIIFEGRRAVGVTFVSNKSSKMGYARARKEIILSAGAMDSPALLMRSGIGPREVLRKAKVPILKELPVGRNLHDHVALPVNIIYGNRSAILSPARDLTPDAWKLFEEKGKGPYSSYMGASAQGFFLSKLQRSTKMDWPDIQITPKSIEGAVPFGEALDVRALEGVTPWHVFAVRPKSRGTVELDPKDADASPLIDFRFLTHPDDIQVILDGIRLAEHLCEGTTARQTVGCRISSTPLSSCSHLKFRSDAYWTCYIKQKSRSSYHVGGTCRMGSGAADPEAVVDPQLKVIGIEGLRVADASVMLQITNANTQAPVYAIAEKAASLILNDWAEHS